MINFDITIGATHSNILIIKTDVQTEDFGVNVTKEIDNFWFAELSRGNIKFSG